MDEGDYYDMLKDVFGGFPHVIVHYPEALYKHSYNIRMFPERVVSWVYNSNTPRQHRDIAFFGVTPDFNRVIHADKANFLLYVCHFQIAFGNKESPISIERDKFNIRNEHTEDLLVLFIPAIEPVT